MKPAGPLISIIVPVHQGARTLPHALSAIADSDLARDAWELVVVDDASTDDTAMIAAKYADASTCDFPPHAWPSITPRSIAG